jgi:magnesium-transporting ATPase (P-type)
MIGCLNAWSAGGWHLGLQLDPTSTVYIKGTTMTFAGIVVAQAGNVLGSRTNKASIFKTSLRNNKWIWLGIVTQISILALIVYVPLLQGAFGTTSLTINDWAFLAVLALVVIFAEEIRKWFARKLAK